MEERHAKQFADVASRSVRRGFRAKGHARTSQIRIQRCNACAIRLPVIASKASGVALRRDFQSPAGPVRGCNMSNSRAQSQQAKFCQAKQQTLNTTGRRPLLTGNKTIDTLIPIGKDQRQLLIGDNGLGKSSLAIDIVVNQRDKNVPNYSICISGSIVNLIRIRQTLLTLVK